MKKAKRLVSLLLVAVMTLSLLAGCGDKNRKTEKAQVNYPVPTDAEAVVDAASGLAVNYYLAGRAYLDAFINYDVSGLTEDNYAQYTALVDNAVRAFENADKMNAVLNEALDVFEQEENGEGPKAQQLSAAASLGITAYAAEMGSKEWAQSIMDEYAKAKPGYAIRHLASQLGTDAKHAYAQMKMAQDILMGAEYTQIADKANTAMKTATVLKTAGTAAGLVIAVATAPASGALATAVSTGGITMSGVNTVLEIGSTASILYTNGEDNEFSMACDKTEAQLAPIGQIFAIAGVGANIKDLAGAGKDIWKNGYNSLDAKTKEELAMNSFGVISYGAGAINDYVNGGSIMSGTFTKGDDGIKFTLINTLTGTEPDQQKNVTDVLKNAGVSEERINSALEKSGETDPAPVKMSTDTMTPEVSQKIIDSTAPIMRDDFDLDAYLALLQKVLYEIAEMGYEEENSGNSKNEPDKSPSENSNTGKNNSSNSNTEQQGGTGATGVTIDDIMGSWSYSSEGITENYTFSQANDTVTVVMTASKADGTTSDPVTFTCEYAFDGNVLVISNSKWHNDMKLRLISKDSLEITSKGTFVLTRNK
ncbi:MAG: hypothetical protein IJ788_01915 [Oscillospiraceae bacterium]|nr:hypothetical protein [Oscillospiraceae bacterium]